MDLPIKIGMLVIFFGIMIGIGIYCRKHSTNVDGFVLIPVISLLTKPPEKEYVEKVFLCYNKKVLVSVTDAIGEEDSL